MKKRFLPIVIILILALAACGGDAGGLVDAAATEAAKAAATAAAVATDIADGPDSGGSENAEPTEAPTKEPTEEPMEGPTGETFDVDPTQPIEVVDSSGTQIKFGDDPFEDENGNPPAGDVNVNVFTAEGAEAEGSSDCEEPGTTEALTVWSYNPETGLWVEENPAPIADDRCVEPVGTVSVEVSDDDGNEYGLAEGETAEVSVPCAPTPDEVLTVWSYDEETGLWVEEDTVVAQEGNTCSAEVSDLSGSVAFASEPLVEGTVEGTIVDLNTGEAIFDAEVCVLSTLVCAYTDAAGFYSLPNVSTGEQTISVGNIGYISTEETVTVTGGETLTQDFALTAEVAEGVSPDWVELQEDTLQDPVFLTGMLLDDRTVTESQGQATLATGHIFAYRNFPYYKDHPLLGITSGMNGWALVISNNTNEDMIFAPTAKESQTAAGSAALQNLIALTANTVLVIRDIGETNNPVKQGDIVEISYGSAGNMSLPYILTIYRPETGEILATFELNSQ